MPGPRSKEDKLAFIAAYLKHGRVTLAAREIGIPRETCQTWSREIRNDPQFQRELQEMRDRVLPELEEKLNETVDLIIERVETPDPSPEDLAGIAVKHGLKSFSYMNPKPAYMGQAINFMKVVSTNRQKALDSTLRQNEGPAVVINLTGDAEVLELGPAEPDAKSN